MALKLKSKEDVRLAIRRRGKEISQSMSDRDVFLSDEFRQYTLRLADFILRKHKLYSLDILYDSNMDTVAYTDGKKIVWNTGNEIAAHPKHLEGRFKVNMGILFHETAHKLFLDFNTSNRALTTIENGKLFGSFPVKSGSDEELAMQEMEEVLTKGYGGAMARVYGHISNIINDGHDEDRMKGCFPGFIASCIEAAGEAQMELAPTLEEVIAKRANDFSILTSLMLQYAKYGYYKVNEENADTERYLEQMHQLEPLIDEALQEDDYKKRWTHFNMIVIALWPVLRQMFPDNPQQQSGGGQSGSGSPNPGGGNSAQDPNNSGQQSAPGGHSSMSDEELQSLIQQIMEEVQKANHAAPAPTGTGKAVDPQTVASGIGGMSQGEEGDIQSIAEQLGQALAGEEVQQELDRAQMDAIRNMNQPLIHKNVPVSLQRHFATDKAKYEAIYKDVAPIVRNLISEILALLREYNEEHIQHHKRFGPIVEATEAYRLDNAFFAKRTLPEDRPNMAMCILLDESGSMHGNKMESSKRALILLERFAAGIGVPILIAGHNVSSDVELNIYTDFLSTQSEKDRYALAAIQSGGCNRDGLPIRICAEMLAQRQEDIRLMVVISDGAPNDSGYSGKEARDDIRKTVSEFRRKGLQIYGAAIDDDKEVIQDIYGQGFLSITDLRSLPKAMVRLLRQNIV